MTEEISNGHSPPSKNRDTEIHEGEDMIQKKEGGVLTPRGFQSSGVHANIKKERRDISLLYTQKEAIVAGTFTQNQIKAPSVVRNQELLERQEFFHALIVNSKIANVVTGERGVLNNQKMAEILADKLGLFSDQVLTGSTGIIGAQLPMEKIETGIAASVDALGETPRHGLHAAEGICTTDTCTKEVAYQFEWEGKSVTIGGMAKGSGMINPNMATMFSFLTTDVSITKPLLQKAMRKSVEDSYNLITVDGDTSTNDMTLIFANGAAQNLIIDDEESEGFSLFCEALDAVNHHLAREIVKDGEGAKKLITFEVNGAKSYADAKRVIHAISSSSLVKTAFYGEDANWGRILCAIGYSEASIEPNKISLEYKNSQGSIKLLEKGEPLDFDERLAKKILEEREIDVRVDLDVGKKRLIGYGCDLSHEYVEINGSYRS